MLAFWIGLALFHELASVNGVSVSCGHEGKGETPPWCWTAGAVGGAAVHEMHVMRH
jgi:hypothetical protein